MKLRFSVLLLVFFVSFAFADINVPDITDNIISIGEATIVWIDNDISSSGQRDVYSFTAPRDGTYRFEMAELRGAYVRLILAVVFCQFNCGYRNHPHRAWYHKIPVDN